MSRRTASLTAALAATMLFGTLVPPFFSAFSSFLIADFRLSRAQFGVLITAHFLVAALSSPVIGRITDRLPGRTVLGILYGLVAASFLSIAVTPGFLLLLTVAAVSGVPQAMTNPVTNRVIAGHVAGTAQGVVTGVKQSAVQLSPLLSGLVLVPLAVLAGWRTTALIVALTILLAYPLVTVVVSRATRARPRGTASVQGASPPRLVAWLTAFGAIMGIAVACVASYLPLFAQEGLRFTVASSGVLFGLLGVGGVTGRVAWGWIASRTQDPRQLLPVLALGAALSLALFLASGWIPAVMWVAAPLFGSTATSWAVVAALSVVRLIGVEKAGRSSAWVHGGFFVGYVLAPPVFGYGLDRGMTYLLGWGIVTCVLLLAFVVAAVPVVSRARIPSDA